MTLDELRRTVKKQPFAPFTINMADGRHFEVPHPEYVGVPPEGRVFAFFDKGRHVELIDVLLVTSLSTVTPTA
jgi:hypothetical protein